MNSISAGAPQPLAALFEIPTKRSRLAAAEAAGPDNKLAPAPEVRQATYEAVATHSPAADGTGEMLVILRVNCPYCEHIHVHPGGTTRRPVRGERQARCIGRPTSSLRYKLDGGEE